MLEVLAISKNYAGLPLLRDITFSVQQHETVCLLGASGSGKSTLLRIIAGLEMPDSGQVCWDGADLATVPVYQRNFGLVFQDYALFPHLSVADNVAFGLRIGRRSSDEIKARLASLLELVNLSGFENRRVTDLSGGEQQRVALARALAPSPRLLMFDEPLGALDRNLREKLLDELRRVLKSSGVPAVYVTHDQEEAFTVADRILMLHEGSIVRQGPPAEIWNHPGSAWVARFLDIGPVLEANLRLEDGKQAAVTRFGIFPLQSDADLAGRDKVNILLRPELARRSEANGLTGQVTDVFFHQGRFKVTLDNDLYIYLPEPVQVGETLSVHYPPEAIQVLA